MHRRNMRVCTCCQRAGHAEEECYKKKRDEERKRIGCYCCGQQGHIARDCPEGACAKRKQSKANNNAMSLHDSRLGGTPQQGAFHNSSMELSPTFDSYSQVEHMLGAIEAKEEAEESEGLEVPDWLCGVCPEPET